MELEKIIQGLQKRFGKHEACIAKTGELFSAAVLVPLVKKKGRLEVFEGGLIKMGLLLGLINIALSILLLTSLIGLLEGIPLELYVKWLNEKVLNAFHWFYQLRTTKGVTAL